jgi:hypothetical protein
MGKKASLGRQVARLASINLAAAFLAVAGLPASAAELQGGGGTASTTASSGEHLYSATLTVDIAPAPNNRVLVTLNCQAEATPDASATSIGICSVGGLTAPSVSVPGEVATTAIAGLAPAGLQTQACIAGGATYVESALGRQTVTAPERCASISLVSENVG